MKAAVVLVNLGGPDKLENVQPFLFNLFSDPDIFKLPFGEKGQELFAGLISKYRAPKSAILYEEIGGSSPLHPNTLDQAAALQKTLREVDDFQVHVAQRYWHPLIPEVIEKLSHETLDKIVLLPLFPQYSNTTTLSVINEWVRHGEGLIAPIIIQRFHQHPKYIEACRERIKEKLSLKLGAALMKPVFNSLKKQYDYEEHGGTPLLGLNGVCIIAHGSAGAKSIKNSIFVAKKCVEENFVENTHKSIKKFIAEKN